MPPDARHPTPAARAAPSLRTELLLNLAVLAFATLVCAVAGVLLLFRVGEPAHAALWLAVLVLLDVAVFVVFGAYLLRRLVLRPLADTLAAAEAIAAGDLARRVPAGGTREFQRMARSVNRMTDRLLEERRQLVRAEKLASIGRLAAGVAHEIGNPLGAIQGYLHLARRGDGDRTREALAGLEREAGRIDRIVRGLLDYARSRKPTPSATDVGAIARSALELLEGQGALRGLELTLDLSTEPTLVTADRHDLEQVFVNLLLNASHALAGSGRVVVSTRRCSRDDLAREGQRRRTDPASGAGQGRDPSPRVRVWLDAHATAEAVKIVVADSGPGIPPVDADRVFDPFFTTKAPGQGTGLGLAIVLRIVDDCRGAVWVETAREGGAAFHILLPALAGAPSLVAHRPPPLAALS